MLATTKSRRPTLAVAAMALGVQNRAYLEPLNSRNKSGVCRPTSRCCSDWRQSTVSPPAFGVLC